MSEIINEKISAVAIFDREKRAFMPIKIKWQSRTYFITKIGLHYPLRAGRKLIHVFCVLSSDNTSFKLRLDTDSLEWTLEEVIDEFAC